MESYLVIGGEGFVGHTMVTMLLERYPNSIVSSLDIVQRHFPEEKAARKWTFYSADLTSLEQLSAAIKTSGATTVFHTASPWTGSGADVCEKVNVVGTQTVVDACVQEGVKKLVFTSSAGTVYDGQNLTNVDERMPFPEVPLDPYNLTKAKAESIVLEANGKKGLLTVAIRPAGIFGPGDRQAIPGFINVLKSGKTGFQLGDNKNLFDWTYVDNVVHAHLIAAERIEAVVKSEELEVPSLPIQLDAPRRPLSTSTYRATPELLEQEKSQNPEFEQVEPEARILPGRGRFDQFSAIGLGEKRSMSVAGQAFFVTNGEPIAFWDFARAIWAEYNGHVASRVTRLPVSLGLFFASVGELACWILGKPTPNLTRGKVVYSTVDRFYNIEKARQVLGYEPIVGLEEGIKRSIAWYKSSETA